MKRFFTGLCVLALLAGLGCGKPKTPEIAIPQNIPLYGFTEQGVFFIHQSLVENIKGENPRLVSQITDWKPRKMEQKGVYWVYDCHAQPKDFGMFQFYKGFPVEYYFEAGFNKSIPNNLLQFEGLFLSQELRLHETVGYIFLTEPVENSQL